MYIKKKIFLFLRVLKRKLNLPPDDEGANPNTESYGAQHGYTITILPARGLVELRASYFSHHTSSQVRSHDNNRCTNSSSILILTFLVVLSLQDDSSFTFSFNLIVSRDGEEVKLPLTKTCSPALEWAPREVTCEVNYMEVTKLLHGSEQELVFIRVLDVSRCVSPEGVCGEHRGLFNRHQRRRLGRFR